MSRILSLLLVVLALAAPSDAQPLGGQCVEISGDGRIDIPGPGRVGMVPEKTIEGWLWLGTPTEPTPERHSSLYCEGSSTGWPVFIVQLEDDGKVHLGVHRRGRWHTFISQAGAIAWQTWHHVAVRVKDDSVGMFFLDGQRLPLGTGPGPGVPLSDSNPKVSELVKKSSTSERRARARARAAAPPCLGKEGEESGVDSVTGA